MIFLYIHSKHALIISILQILHTITPIDIVYTISYIKTEDNYIKTNKHKISIIQVISKVRVSMIPNQVGILYKITKTFKI